MIPFFSISAQRGIYFKLKCRKYSKSENETEMWSQRPHVDRMGWHTYNSYCWAQSIFFGRCITLQSIVILSTFFQYLSMFLYMQTLLASSLSVCVCWWGGQNECWGMSTSGLHKAGFLAGLPLRNQLYSRRVHKNTPWTQHKIWWVIFQTALLVQRKPLCYSIIPITRL